MYKTAVQSFNRSSIEKFESRRTYFFDLPVKSCKNHLSLQEKINYFQRIKAASKITAVYYI